MNLVTVNWKRDQAAGSWNHKWTPPYGNELAKLFISVAAFVSFVIFPVAIEKELLYPWSICASL